MIDPCDPDCVVAAWLATVNAMLLSLLVDCAVRGHCAPQHDN